MKKGWFLILIVFSSCFKYSSQKHHVVNGLEFKENYHIELKEPEWHSINLEIDNEVKIHSKYRLIFDEKLIERLHEITNSYEIKIRTELLTSPFEFASNGISTLSRNSILHPEYAMKIELFQKNKKIDFEFLEGLVVKYYTRDQYYSGYKLYNNANQSNRIKSWNCPQDIDICKIEFEEKIGTLIGYDAQGKKTKTENHIYYTYLKEVTLKPIFKDWILVARKLKIYPEHLKKISFQIHGLDKDTRVGAILSDYGHNGYIELEPKENTFSTYYTKFIKFG